MATATKMKKAKMLGETRVRTGEIRCSYVHVFEKYEKSGKYQLHILIDKKDKTTLDLIKKAVAAAKEKGKNELWKGKIPGDYASPLSDGDDKDDEAYEGKYFLNAKNSYRRPRVVQYNDEGVLEDIDDPEEFYSGCYAQVALTFFPYANSGHGVGTTIDNILKTRDGDPLGGGSYSADNDFGDDDDDDGDVAEDDLL